MQKKSLNKKKSGSTSPPQSGKRDSKLVQARAALYLHPRPLKGAIRVTGSRRRQIKNGAVPCAMSGKRDSKLVQARAPLYLHPRPLKGAIRVTGQKGLERRSRSRITFENKYLYNSATLY